MAQDVPVAARMVIMAPAVQAAGGVKAAAATLALHVTLPLVSRTPQLDRALLAEHALWTERLAGCDPRTTRGQDFQREIDRLRKLLSGLLGEDEANRKRADAEVMVTRAMCGDVAALTRLAPIAEGISPAFAAAVQEALAAVPV